MADYTWNYRLVEFPNGTWAVREVLYNSDDEMVAWYPRATQVSGQDREQLLENLDRFMRASFFTHLGEEDTEDLIKLDEKPSSTMPWKE